MDQIHGLRYSVYCEECKYLPAEDHPDRRERDFYDAQSAHFCSFNHAEELVGYVRLVATDDSGSFPFQKKNTVLFSGIDLPPPALSGEISRLMVSKAYRRRGGDTIAGTNAHEERRAAAEKRLSSPQILLSMYRRMYQYSIQNGIRYWYAAMERPLARSLLRLDFRFQQVGPEMDYYGPVAPYLADLRELESSGDISNPALWSWLRSTEP